MRLFQMDAAHVMASALSDRTNDRVSSPRSKKAKTAASQTDDAVQSPASAPSDPNPSWVSPNAVVRLASRDVDAAATSGELKRWILVKAFGAALGKGASLSEGAVSRRRRFRRQTATTLLDHYHHHHHHHSRSFTLSHRLTMPTSRPRPPGSRAEPERVLEVLRRARLRRHCAAVWNCVGDWYSQPNL